jgi:hypothetical protein
MPWTRGGFARSLVLTTALSGLAAAEERTVVVVGHGAEPCTAWTRD